MFHAGGARSGRIFPPYQVFTLGATRVGFVGYNDPHTPSGQFPAYSRVNATRLAEESPEPRN